MSDTWRTRYFDLLKEYSEGSGEKASQIHRLQRDISEQIETINKRNNEISHLRSVENALKQANHAEKEIVKVLESKVAELSRELSGLEVTIDILRREKDSALSAQRLAEARVSDLQDALRIERGRFDSAIARERDVEDGMRSRIGLLPKPEGGNQATTQTPISTRRQPWPTVAAGLEAKAKEEHWQKKIREVEQKDAAAEGTQNASNANRATS